MDGNNISKTTAKNIALENLMVDLQGDIELTECSVPTGGLAYALNGRDPANFYFFHINPLKPAVGNLYPSHRFVSFG